MSKLAGAPSRRHPGRAFRWAVPAIALLLLLAMALEAAHHLARQPAIDLYNPWGVHVAHAALGGNPYVDTEAYSRTLDAAADGSESAELRSTNALRRLIDPTATPLFYTVFAFLPRDFAGARGVMAVLLYAALLAAVWAMARMCGLGSWSGLGLAALVALTFAPFEVDARVGNVNALQVAAIVAFVHAARSGFAIPMVEALYLPALALFVAFKPNIAPVAAALAVHFVFTRGRAAVLRGIAASIATLAAAYALAAWYFHSAAVWGDWYGFVHGPDGAILYAVRYGNASIAKLMSEYWPGIDPYAFGLLLGAALAAFIAAALTAFGRDPAGARARLREALADPWCMASVGVLFMFAMSPLLWPHYEVLALVPAFWLFRDGSPSRGVALCIVAAYVLLSRPLGAALLWGHVAGADFTALLVGWLPLAAAFCASLGRRAPAAGSRAPALDD
ncbi:MAG TPA: glycosyltransferase 87 family protein [Usitatibacter sp.]|nr:glycosyltransferase 87 family protein [Usitatibacter sp.]